MLELFVSEKEFFDGKRNTFVQIPSCTITLEHSLISLSKWESKWQIPYFNGVEKTQKQNNDYIRCMAVGQIKDDRIFDTLSADELLQIQSYIESPMTATTFSSRKESKKTKKDVITAEVIYSQMFAFGISMECQKWHLNRLLTLIKVCNLQNGPGEKMSTKDAVSWAAEQNAARQAKYNTKG